MTINMQSSPVDTNSIILSKFINFFFFISNVGQQRSLTISANVPSCGDKSCQTSVASL